MTLNRISKTDLNDLDIADAYELRSDGYGLNSIYFTTTVVSTTSGTKTVVVNLASDGEGILYSYDHPVEPDDIVHLYGTTGADGYYTVATIIDDLTFTVNETIATSTGGSAEFRYPAGALKIGFDPRNTTHVFHNNVQQAIEDLDVAISGGSTSISTNQHKSLRQLIHLADGIGGPFEGFLTGAYREVLPANSVFPTSITWYEDITKVKKIVQKTISYNAQNIATVFNWKAYDTDGLSILGDVTDTITYSGAIELSRLRTIVDNGTTNLPVTEESHKALRQLVHLADGIGGPFEGFTSGAYRESLPSADPFPTSVIWYDDITKTKKIVEKTIIYNANKSVSSVTWKVYDTDGTTLLATVSDAITYSGIFEINRTRTIS